MPYLEIEKKISDYFKPRAVNLLRYSMGVIFLWYGLLKVFDKSPVHELVWHALGTDNNLYVVLIGIWEVLMGVLFFFKKSLRWGLILMFLHFPGTFLPLFMKPEACFTSIPFGLTLEGQYIFKNLILISAALVLVASLHQKKAT